MVAYLRQVGQALPSVCFCNIVRRYQRAPEELLTLLDMKRSGDKDFTHGEFVMSWSDFVALFEQVCIAIIQPRGWTEAAVTGRWPAAPRHLWHFRACH